MKTSLWKEVFMYILAGLVSAGEIAMIILLIYLWMHGVATENSDIINLIYGLCIAYHSGFMLVLGYFFGSSKGSADKTEAMVDTSKKLTEEKTDLSNKNNQ